MRIDIFSKWMVRALSAGGAMLLAACYGPARPEHRSVPVKKVSGVVEMDGRPVAKAVVCEKSELDRCPMTGEDGRFELYLENARERHEICARPLDNSVAFVPGCVSVSNDASGDFVTITVGKPQ